MAGDARERAVRFVKVALALLERCGEELAAARLSQALDVLEPIQEALDDEALERRLSELMRLSEEARHNDDLVAIVGSSAALKPLSDP